MTRRDLPYIHAPEDVSPAMQLMLVVWDGSGKTTGHAWLRFNQSLYAAAKLAITSGLRFNVGDFKAFSEHLSFGHWGGSSYGGCGESLYTLAIGGYREPENRSACIAYEAYAGRTPWIFADGYRVAIDSVFTWEDAPVKVTSFNDSADVLNCLRGRGQKRVRITREQWKAAQKAERDAKKAAKPQTEAA